VENSDRIITLLEILSEPQTESSDGFDLPERVAEKHQRMKHEDCAYSPSTKAIPLFSECIHN
jgi:hypothetical protein